MSVPRKVTTWVCIIGALMMLAWPDMADAQRRGIRRRARPVLHTRIWYGPGFYGPYAYGPYSYGQWGPWGPYPYYGRYDVRGSVRIEVKPEETEVYVDGYYVGVVDSYDGVFQRLHLPPGPHDIELRLEGHHSLQEQM